MTPNSIRQLKSFVTTDRCSLSHLAYLAQFAEPLLLVGSSLIIARQNREKPSEHSCRLVLGTRPEFKRQAGLAETPESNHMTSIDLQPLQGTTTALRGVRRAAAKQMILAWQAPAFHLSLEVDMTNALAVKSISSESTVTDRLISATALTLQEHPGLNAHYSDGEVTTFNEINIGIAVATDAGLTVPVIQGTQDLNMPELAQRRRQAVERARTRKLDKSDLSGGTFTISNLGMLGISRFDAIVNVPQVAILAVAATKQRFVMRDGKPEWRPIAELTLTCDHRAVDGYMGAMFINRLKDLLEAPITG